MRLSLLKNLLIIIIIIIITITITVTITITITITIIIIVIYYNIPDVSLKRDFYVIFGFSDIGFIKILSLQKHPSTNYTIFTGS